jgi:resuscitation-promoting factor RpfB
MNIIQKNKAFKIISIAIILISSVLLLIELQKKSVTILIDGEKRQILSQSMTVKDILIEQGIELSEHDFVQPSANTELNSNMVITYKTAKKVHLNVGDDKSETWTTADTVGELLKEENIQISELDVINLSLDDQVMQDQQIIITRVRKENIVIEEKIEYKVQYQKDATLLKGIEKVVQSGKKGLKEKHFEVTFINGVEQNRLLTEEKVVTKQQNKIVAIGTKPRTVSAFKTTDNVAKEFYVEATAYTALCDTGCTGITATGINLLKNPTMKVIAVDPKVIPLGTRVYVEGYGYAIAGDTGGAIKGNKIDVFITTKEEALKWGRRTVKIKILQ